MKAVIAAFYREPVVFLGVVQAVAVALGAEGVISAWVSAAIVAALVPVQRYFVTPDPSK